MWVDKIKHDGNRLMVQRTPPGIRIRTRRGYDWTDRFPLIVEAASRLRAESFVIDGEGVVLDQDGNSIFTGCTRAGTMARSSFLASTSLNLTGSTFAASP
jgi:bifunctional non-homologous end joining protein LigD